MPKTYAPDLAVALKYDGKNAPKVTSKGTDLTAEQILQVAEQHGIPLQTEPEPEPARIPAQIPLGDEIPNELYVAVAEVIALRTSHTAKTPDSYNP